MGSLAIRRVTYWGDKYHYSSPEFDMGLQIIQASNGAGKTTFSAFICYGLGMYVRQFDFKEKAEIHKEVSSDTNNYILIDILIDSKLYQLTRYFQTQQNTVFIKGEDGTEDSFPIYRTNKEDVTFSDWILSKLGIEVCEIYQGTKKFKINFSDLFRLIHYDQETSVSKIYKEHRNDNNFVSDSTTVRKVIFELLIGHQFSEYYAMMGELNRIEREKDTHKATLDSYLDMTSKMGYQVNKMNPEELTNQIREYNHQLEKLNFYRESLKEKRYDSSQLNNHVRQLRNELVHAETRYSELKLNKRNTSLELSDLLQLKEDIILEATQIKKIILAHQELNLFSPNTCPCCLRDIQRQENHCICGSPIDETQYEKFFYDSEEYLDILKSKQKSVETIEAAIGSCKEELSYFEDELARFDLQKEKIMTQLRQVEKDLQLNASDSELNAVNEKILEVKESIQSIEQKKTLYEKYEELDNNLQDAKEQLSELKQKLAKMEIGVNILLKKQVAEFSEIYRELLIEADKDVITAYIDEDYMPVINGGVYRQASSNVAKRFIYFLSLLKMAITNDEMPFPRFLLIDTPENLGIDRDNLNKCLSQILKVVEGATDFQIILTTGLGKFPSELEEYVAETLTSDKKLLKERIAEQKTEVTKQDGTEDEEEEEGTEKEDRD
ncbi:hypothetical protein [Brevibacillus parabrevis]|uniref:hypothetical protein n=1 Tax=Brevibacillus parabrevis TaxID=54914 RepID=UPI001F603040|nr:hypothetical protein [Brevibacillus parabrevis]MDR4998979.1 hypothetical protein [Brevibacillus parabrevis]